MNTDVISHDRQIHHLTDNSIFVISMQNIMFVFVWLLGSMMV